MRLTLRILSALLRYPDAEVQQAAPGLATALAEDGLLSPEQRASLSERSPQTRITPASFTLDRDRLSAASPNGAMELMLGLVRRLYGDGLAEGVEEILSFSGARYRQVGPGAKKSMSL